MSLTELTEHYCAHAEEAAWQHALRCSVRLQLALSEPGLNPGAVRATLALVEHALRQQLRASDPASAETPEAADTAVVVLQLSQMALLSQRSAAERLRGELPVTTFAHSLSPTCHPHPVGTWGSQAA